MHYRGCHMSKSIFTQKALADTFKSLLLEMPLEKISVKDIATRCGISRNAYYYYYKDKFELMWWIVEYEMREIVKVYDISLNISNAYIKACNHFYDNRKFYYPCLQYQGQNSFYEYLTEFLHELTCMKLTEQCVSENLPYHQIPLDVYSRMLSGGMVEAIRMWHADGFRDNYKTFLKPVQDYIDLQHRIYSEGNK